MPSDAPITNAVVLQKQATVTNAACREQAKRRNIPHHVCDHTSHAQQPFQAMCRFSRTHDDVGHGKQKSGPVKSNSQEAAENGEQEESLRPIEEVRAIHVAPQLREFAHEGWPDVQMFDDNPINYSQRLNFVINK